MHIYPYLDSGITECCDICEVFILKEIKFGKTPSHKTNKLHFYRLTKFPETTGKLLRHALLGFFSGQAPLRKIALVIISSFLWAVYLLKNPVLLCLYLFILSPFTCVYVCLPVVVTHWQIQGV